jgi:hypothetical protein
VRHGTGDLALVVALAALAVTASAAGRPPPPPDWSSRVERPRLSPGAIVAYTYRATSDDAFDLHVTLQSLPRGARVLRPGTSPYRLVAGKPTWTLRFSGRRREDRSFRLRVRVPAAARAGARFCLVLRQVARYGGVPDDVSLPVCDTLRAP